MCAFSLSQEEHSALEKQFQDEEPSLIPMINYRAFCDAITSFKHLEKTPLETPDEIDAHPQLENSLSPREDKRVSELLIELRTFVRTRCIIVKPVFQDFDKFTLPYTSI